ncbi:hypothetical protein, partial [Methylicorpusculum sp.]|uniref:hypothetical protein n=1 Tax=Methylicorpusculum sp. TaxID=2713644 RepID=UPI002ABBC131
EKIKEYSSTEPNNNSFLSPAYPKNTKTKQLILSQEFDLVTSRHIIECKCIQGNVDKYIGNLNREQFMTILTKKLSQAPNAIVITSGGENYPTATDIQGKKVVCYIKYTNPAPQYTEAQAAEEVQLINKGYAIWNGSFYCHSITQAYIDNDYPKYTELKKLIQNIGPEKFVLNCIIKNETEQQAMTKKLEEGDITKIIRLEGGIKPTPQAEEKCAAFNRLQEGVKKRAETPQRNYEPDTQMIAIAGILFSLKPESENKSTLASIYDLADSLEQFTLQSPPPKKTAKRTTPASIFEQQHPEESRSEQDIERGASDSYTHATKKPEIEIDDMEMKIEQQEPETTPQTNMEQADAQMDVEQTNQEQQNQSHEPAMPTSNAFRKLFDK